jgi:hypothetical protein
MKNQKPLFWLHSRLMESITHSFTRPSHQCTLQSSQSLPQQETAEIERAFEEVVGMILRTISNVW